MRSTPGSPARSTRSTRSCISTGCGCASVNRQLEAKTRPLAGWKGYYMYRNLFVVHLRYGENALVRAKPWLITAAVVLLSPVRGGRAEARNVIRAMRDARGMRVGPS